METQSLTNNDYKNILKYYNMKIPKSNETLKKNAEKIIADKLCKCIKSFDTKDEAKAIPICTKSILKKKGFSRGNFSCKKKKVVRFAKIKKTRKNKL